MSVCAAFDPAGPYAGQVLALADCHALALGTGGYQALAGFGAVLAALLTVFAALLGYRLMLGQGPSLGEGAGLLARVALVLALATQWPAYQALVFDVVMGAPRGLAGALAGAAGLGPVDPAAQAVQVDALLAQVSAVIATPDPAPALRPGLRVVAAQGLPDAVRTPVHWAGGLVVTTLLAGWLSMRLVAGVLLGLGPLLVGGLLFAGTRGLALGWVRVLVGATLGQVVVALVLGLELGLVQAQMAGLVQALGTAPVAMADGLLVTAGVFALVMLVGLIAMGGVASGLAWPKAWRQSARHDAVPMQAPALTVPIHHRTGTAQRVEQITAAARAMERRDAGRPVTMRMQTQIDRPSAQARDGRQAPQAALVIRLGQSARRGLPALRAPLTEKRQQKRRKGRNPMTSPMPRPPAGRWTGAWPRSARRGGPGWWRPWP
jgi:type IV secretion system protein VirB6